MAYYSQATQPWASIVSQPAALPPLIFLHSLGGGSSAFEWSKVYSAFATTHRVLAPDLIGWGESAHPARNYCVEDYLVILAEFIRQVADQPVAIAASSLTAGLLVRLAIQQPELFRLLFLVSPSGYGDFGSDYQNSIPAQLSKTPLLDQLIYAVGAANELAVRNFLQQFLFAERSRLTEEIVAAYLTSAQKPNAEYAALSSLRGDLCFDLAQYLPQLTIPTVLVWGEESSFSSSEKGQRFASLNPQAIHASHSIPVAGVLPHLEVPGVVIGLLQHYLNLEIGSAQSSTSPF